MVTSESNERLSRQPLSWLLIAGAVAVGLAVRIPGVFWGSDFPGGWRLHHPDEYTHLVNANMIIDPGTPPPHDPHPYPKGMAAMVALPIGALRIADGSASDPPPPPREVVLPGRCVSVAYGTLTIVLVAMLARCYCSDRRIAHLAAWLMALGGLHVTQSHFFTSDVSSLFWLLLGLILLDTDIRRRGGQGSEYLMWAALCFGAAFGMKLLLSAVPGLVLASLLRKPRFMRASHGLAFFLVGFVVINGGSYTTADFFKTLTRGIGDPNYHFSRISSVLLYVPELPAVVSAPLALTAVAGAIGGVWIFLRRLDASTRRRLALVLLLPVGIQAALTVWKLAHFPRHLVALMPWIVIASAWLLVRGMDRSRRAGIPAATVPVVVLAYLAVFVYDGERFFLRDPRDEAARWVRSNVPSGSSIWWEGHDDIGEFDDVWFPEKARPDVLVIGMLNANHYLSGLGLRDSMPRDYGRIFDGQSQERIDALQAVFRGESEYAEVARFEVGYFMPEFRLMDRWFGDRSRNYLTDVVVFRRSHEATGEVPASG